MSEYSCNASRWAEIVSAKAPCSFHHSADEARMVDAGLSASGRLLSGVAPPPAELGVTERLDDAGEQLLGVPVDAVRVRQVSRVVVHFVIDFAFCPSRVWQRRREEGCVGRQHHGEARRWNSGRRSSIVESE